MAYVKIIPIRTKLNRAINYVLNADKTGLDKALDYIFDSNKTTDKKHVVYESAINCQKNRAYQNMISTKKDSAKLVACLAITLYIAISLMKLHLSLLIKWV